MRLETETVEQTLTRQLLKYLQNKKRYGRKKREYEQFCKSLTDEEKKVTLSPDEIKLKLSQIHTWREDTNDKYKNNV